MGVDQATKRSEICVSIDLTKTAAGVGDTFVQQSRWGEGNHFKQRRAAQDIEAALPDVKRNTKRWTFKPFFRPVGALGTQLW